MKFKGFLFVMLLLSLPLYSYDSLKTIVRKNGPAEKLNIRRKERLRQFPFFYLIGEKEGENRSFIAARIEYKDGTVEYVDAHALNLSLFHGNLYPKYHDSLEYVVWKNPKNGRAIKDVIEYYTIKGKTDPQFVYLCNSNDLSSPEERLFFDANCGFVSDVKTINAMYEMAKKKDLTKKHELAEAINAYEYLSNQYKEPTIRARALFKLAELYCQKNMVAKEKYYLKLAAGQKNNATIRAQSLMHLGDIALIEANNGKKAVHYYEQALAADLDQENKCLIQIQLAHMFYYGQSGVKVNYLKAKDYFEYAQEQENNKRVVADAQVHLATMYYYGSTGIQQDVKKAKEYYEKAANQDDVADIKTLAQLQLAQMYRFAIGVEQDTIYAKMLYQQVIENSPDKEIKKFAYQALGDIFRTGNGFYKNYRRSRKYYNLALKDSSVENRVHILTALGDLSYKGGFGIQKDINDAKNNYSKALQLADTKQKNIIESRLKKVEEIVN